MCRLCFDKNPSLAQKLDHHMSDRHHGTYLPMLPYGDLRENLIPTLRVTPFWCSLNFTIIHPQLICYCHNYFWPIPKSWIIV